MPYLWMFRGAGCSASSPGETGAGKSILLAGLGLVTGARVQAGMIGVHSDRAEVSAAFQLNPGHPALSALKELDLEAPDGTLILRRTIGTDGRTKAFVNASPVPVATLAALGTHLVEIQGQFDQIAILNPRHHRPTLDEAGGLQSLLAEVSTRHLEREQSQTALDEETARLQTLAAEEEYLRYALAELEAANLMEGEAEDLATRRQSLRSLSDAAEALGQLSTVLNGDRGVTGQLAKATKLASRLPETLAQELDGLIRALDQAWNSSESASNDLAAKLHDLGDAEQDLEDTSERLFFLKELARKHACQADDLPQKLIELRQTLTTLDQGQENLRRLQQAQLQARAAVSACRAASFCRAGGGGAHPGGGHQCRTARADVAPGGGLVSNRWAGCGGCRAKRV